MLRTELRAKSASHWELRESGRGNGDKVFALKMHGLRVFVLWIRVGA